MLLLYTSGHSLFSREKRALLVAGRVAPLFARRGEPVAVAARLGGARVAVPEDGEHDEVRAAVASMVATVLADVARLKDVQKLREVEALRVESLRARLAAAELEEKIAAERLRELQDRDAAQLIQDL